MGKVGSGSYSSSSSDEEESSSEEEDDESVESVNGNLAVAISIKDIPSDQTSDFIVYGAP